ncbi:MAG: hypothetical protein WC781_00135 [Candidatus Pacearchaeota archaeon]|jgi:hypothetical protein
MVSKKETNKFVPKEIIIPNSKYQLSVTRQDISKRKRSLLETAAEESPVIYDTHLREFVINLRGKRVAVNEEEVYEEETTKIPDYLIPRIEVNFQESVFPNNSFLKEARKFYFNRLRKEWMDEKLRDLATGLQGTLNNYLYGIITNSVRDFNIEHNRRFNPERINELGKYVTNELLTIKKPGKK